jgi:hypothetical protein
MTVSATSVMYPRSILLAMVSRANSRVGTIMFRIFEKRLVRMFDLSGIFNPIYLSQA